MTATAAEEFAPAKVNLALHVTARRGDGYHELDSLVVFPRVGDRLRAEPAADDGVERFVDGLRVQRHDIPPGTAGGYYPECNPLIPLWHHAKESKVPAAKAIPIRLTRTGHAPRAER